MLQIDAWRSWKPKGQMIGSPLMAAPSSNYVGKFSTSAYTIADADSSRSVLALVLGVNPILQRCWLLIIFFFPFLRHADLRSKSSQSEKDTEGVVL